MAKNDSSSSTASSQQNYDNRVAADGGAIAIGAGGSYVNTFSSDVAGTLTSIIDRVLNFSGDVLSKGSDLVSAQVAAGERTTANAISSNQQISQNAQLGNSSLLTQLMPIMAIGAVGLIIFSSFRKK